MKVHNFFSALVIASFALLFANCGDDDDHSSKNADTDKTEVKTPPAPAAKVKSSVSFLAPKDGDAVPTTFTVKMGVLGMGINPAGKIVPNTGHHHLIINGGPIPKGQVVPKDETHIHFGKGQTQTELTLKPGNYTLTLQFADGLHQSYGKEMSSTIHVTVK